MKHILDIHFMLVQLLHYLFAIFLIFPRKYEDVVEFAHFFEEGEQVWSVVQLQEALFIGLACGLLRGQNGVIQSEDKKFFVIGGVFQKKLFGLNEGSRWIFELLQSVCGSSVHIIDKFLHNLLINLRKDHIFYGLNVPLDHFLLLKDLNQGSFNLLLLALESLSLPEISIDVKAIILILQQMLRI